MEDLQCLQLVLVEIKDQMIGLDHYVFVWRTGYVDIWVICRVLLMEKMGVPCIDS